MKKSLIIFALFVLIYSSSTRPMIDGGPGAPGFSIDSINLRVRYY